MREDAHTNEDIVTICGKCKVREWCPIFLISVKRRVIKLLEEENGNAEKAYNIAKVISDTSHDIADEGVTSYLLNLKDGTLAACVPEEEGMAHINKTVARPLAISVIQHMIAEEEKL